MGWIPPERRERGEVPIENISISPIMGLSENSTSTCLAIRSYRKCV